MSQKWKAGLEIRQVREMLHRAVCEG